MKVFFDNIIYSVQEYGGISRYFDEIKKISLIGVSTSQNRPKLYNSKILMEFSKLLKCPVPSDSDIDVFHSSYYRVPTDKKIPSVVTVHDFSHENGYISGVKAFAHKALLKKRAITNASEIICISESTKIDLMKLYPGVDEGRVHVVYNGLSRIYSRLSKIEPSIYKQYCLFVGSRAGYKNFYDAVASIQLVPDVQFYIVGSSLTEDERKILNSRIPGRYSVFSNLEDEDLRSLYRNSICLLYPSSYEGFGLPIIEAFSQGCPVIIYNVPACIEVSKGLALICRNNSFYEMAEYLQGILSVDNYNNSRGFEEVANSYDWDKTRLENKAIYEACL